MTHPNSPDRAALREAVYRLVAHLEAQDLPALAAALTQDVAFSLPHLRLAGREAVLAFLAERTGDWSQVRFHVRRLLADGESPVVALEWVLRVRQADSREVAQHLGGTVLDFAPDGRILGAATYLDQERSGPVERLDAPWPQEPWRPCPEPGPPLSRTQMEALVHTLARAWAESDLSLIDAIVHDQVHLSPPWTYLAGREAVLSMSRTYMANHRDTVVTPHRFIIDPDHPHWGVCQQTFACTNVVTGRRGEDHDYAFFAVCQGKLHYWRTYFDTAQSVQSAYIEVNRER